MRVLQDMLEWVLIGITSDAKAKRVSIQIQDHAGKSHILCCEGVVAFRAEDVLLHNVVESVVTWQDSFDEEAIEVLWELLYGVTCDRREQGWRTAVQDAASEIESGKKTLLRVEPIYGATVTVLAETIGLNS